MLGRTWIAVPGVALRAAASLLLALGVSALPAVGASPASAQGFDTQLFLPPANQGSTFTIDTPGLPRHMSWVFGLSTNFAVSPFVRQQGDVEQDVVAWSSQTELLVALGLFEWMELGVAAPLVVARVADDPLAADLQYSTKASLGDMRLSLKVPILRGAWRLSGRAVVALPSGNDEMYSGSDYWTLTPSLVTSYRLGGLNLAGELGYRFRQRSTLGNLEIDDELVILVGATYDIVPVLAVVGEVQTRVGVGGQTLEASEVPVEGDLGVRWAIYGGWSVDLGVGTGFHSGYGAPSFRGFAIARYATAREPCAAGPEDFDGFEDGDFCADADNDADGMPDEGDRCPNDAEDADGFRDEDGCPDLDNDADSVPDVDDKCPLRSEDQDGYQDQDGCPELDNDEDQVPDGEDKCPMEPEDRDGYEDEDGCPEPGPEAATVTSTDTRILISERIYFDFDRDTIRPISKPLLDQVAAVIKQLSPRKKIRVEGYTDAAGIEAYNVDLSYRRARSVVEYLASRGVPRRRLSNVGRGSQNPVAPNDSPEGQALNRRVEFMIVEPTDRRR